MGKQLAACVVGLLFVVWGPLSVDVAGDHDPAQPLTQYGEPASASENTTDAGPDEQPADDAMDDADIDHDEPHEEPDDELPGELPDEEPAVEDVLDEDPDEPDEVERVVETDDFTLEISGRQTFGLRMGFGSSEALRGVGLTPGVPTLDQSLRADIKGTALGFLTLEASFDDSKGAAFQDLVIRMDRPPWSGVLGDLSAGDAELGMLSKQFLGAELTYTSDEYTVSGMFAREQGISETRTFRGESATAEKRFSYLDPDDPRDPAPYGESVLGLYYYRLRVPFVEGFSEVELTFRVDEGLESFLRRYDLGYLVEGFQAAPIKPLASGAFWVLDDDGDVLLLRSTPEVLLRRRIRDAISDYNTREGLPEEDRKRYPFVEGSELEQEFLDGLTGYAHLEVDEERYQFADARRKRYISLGERDVIEGSLELTVRRPGQQRFRPIDDPALGDYDYKLFPERGVVRLDFPDRFFEENAGLRARYDYKREGNVFQLGLSVIPGSERVFVDGERLQRGTEYTIDYEVGMLILFAALGADQELRVEFERQRGALGVPTEYERGTVAFSFSVPGSDNLEGLLARASDVGRPRPESPTMPNTHTVGGLRLSGDVGGWDYELVMAGSQNVFPPWDNERLALPNRINVIAEAEGLDTDYTVFGHQSGLTVYDGAAFHHYGAREGLGGKEVRDLLALSNQLLVATDEGLTVVDLSEESPFDRVASWSRLRREQGLPGDEAFVLARGPEHVYVVTEDSLAWFSPADATETDEWSFGDLPTDVDPAALLWAEDRLYMGTDAGLYAWDGDSWQAHVAEIRTAVHDLARLEGALYVATSYGVREVRGGEEVDIHRRNDEFLSLSARHGRLWMAGPEGLYRLDRPEPVLDEPLTAVGPGDDALWAGGTADDEFALDLWRIEAGEARRFPEEETRIEGQDLGRFEDIPRIGHTAVGFAGKLALSREVGDWSWQVALSSRGSDYQEIGSTRDGAVHRAELSLTQGGDGPWKWGFTASTGWTEDTPGAGNFSDTHRIGFTADYDGDNDWSGGVRAHWEVSDARDEPTSVLAGRLDASWAPGPTYSLRLTPRLPSDGLFAPSVLESGYRLGAEFPGDTWSGKLSLSGDLRAPDWRTSGKLEAATKVVPFSGWTFELSGFRPYRTDGRPGDQGADLTVRWEEEIDLLRWTVTWNESLRNRIGREELRWERSASTDFRWSRIELGELDFRPRLRLTYGHTARETSGQARLTGDIRLTDTRFDVSATVGQAFRPAIERTQRTISGSIKWSYTGWTGLTPSLEWQGSWELLMHPRYDDRLTEEHDLSGKLVLEPEDADWTNELSLRYRGRDGSYTLSNRLSMPTDWGTLSGHADATWKDGHLQGSVSTTGGWAVGDMWRLNAELGYTMSARPQVEDTVHHGFYGGLFITATF